ncbi:hypothetical protein RLEG12_07530 (plasmid) [Rhizobium leguminosarum bv. trifolii CB782]|nr:hypothetical protein RLEG12_07530 [Rhizobium leguminosarum bv. trifolii CB782]
MVEGWSEAAPYLVVCLGWGFIWFFVSRYKSIHNVPRKQLALLGLGWFVLGFLFIFTLRQ